MADKKITAGTDITTLASTDVIPVARPGNTTAYKATIANLFGNMTPLTIKGTNATDLPTYGAEFLSGAGWTSVDWTGSWAAGWTHTPGNTTVLSQSTAAENATRYQIEFTVTGWTTGTCIISFGGQSFTYTGDPEFPEDSFGPTTTSTANLTITPSSLFDGMIVISIKKITAVSTPIFVAKSSEGTARLEIRAIIGAATANPFGLSKGRHNVLIGEYAAEYMTTAQDCTAIGYTALRDNTTGWSNTAVGAYCMTFNTTGMKNTAMGGGGTLHDNTTGKYNSAFGTEAMFYNTTGSNSTAVGAFSLEWNTTGYDNTAIGYVALFLNTTGYSSVAIGAEALLVNTDGYTNNAVGAGALKANTHGVENNAFGFYALAGNTTGHYNTAMGTYAGRTIIAGQFNTFVGYSAGFHASQNAGAINSMALGNGTYTTASNQVVIGDTNVTQTLLRGNVLVGTITDGMTAGGSLAITQDLAHRGTLAGFYNHALTAQQVLATGAGNDADDIITALQALGLVKQA